MRSASVSNQLMLSVCWWAQPAVAPQVASSHNMEIKLILATIIIISTTTATPQALGPLIMLWSQYRNYLTSPLNTGTSNKQQVFYKNLLCFQFLRFRINVHYSGYVAIFVELSPSPVSCKKKIFFILARGVRGQCHNADDGPS